MRKGHHNQANGPSSRQSTKLDWRELGPLAEFYVMTGRRRSGLEITLTGVGGPCPENHALEPYAWPVSERTSLAWSDIPSHWPLGSTYSFG